MTEAKEEFADRKKARNKRPVKFCKISFHEVSMARRIEVWRELLFYFDKYIILHNLISRFYIYHTDGTVFSEITLFSIFMASMVRSFSPIATLSPAFTRT